MLYQTKGSTLIRPEKKNQTFERSVGRRSAHNFLSSAFKTKILPLRLKQRPLDALSPRHRPQCPSLRSTRGSHSERAPGMPSSSRNARCTRRRRLLGIILLLSPRLLRTAADESLLRMIQVVREVPPRALTITPNHQRRRPKRKASLTMQQRNAAIPRRPKRATSPPRLVPTT